VLDRSQMALAKYELELSGTRKGRGALIATTRQGDCYALREYKGSRQRALIQSRLQERLEQSKIVRTDLFIKSPSGELLVSTDDFKTAFSLKTFLNGRECSVASESDCLASVALLAKIKPFMCFSEDNIDFLPIIDLESEYVRHNKELRRVRSHIRKKTRKSEFELLYLRSFDKYYELALRAELLLSEGNHANYKARVIGESLLCHGNYNYHNIQIEPTFMAITNFDNIYRDSVVSDLYHFLRKVMEKNNWNPRLGDKLLNAYSAQAGLSDEELSELVLRFSYPEKFWKVSNYYYNAGKSWISGRFLEKLESLIMQEENKSQFLKAL